MAEIEQLEFDDTCYPSTITLSRDFLAKRCVAAAVEHARQAIGVNPSRPEAFNLLGICCEYRRLLLEAQKYYRVALALNPSYGPAQRNLHRLVSYHKRGVPDLGGTGC